MPRRTASLAPLPSPPVEAPKRTLASWLRESGPQKEIFLTCDEAYRYGIGIRENAEKEGCGDSVEVDISGKCVRITLKEI